MGGLLFRLTEEIINLIIFGMENQSDEYYVNIENGLVGSKSSILQDAGDSDIDSIALPVPEWHPADGFQLMESFVVSVHNPQHAKALGEILSAGRGAFRNFKSYVKGSDVLAKQWYAHKERVMRSRVVEWYNTNCEILKYEYIDENTDETENLISTDFTFLTDCPDRDDLIKRKSEEAVRECMDSGTAAVTDYILKRNEGFFNQPGVTSLSVCAETPEGELAGVIYGGTAGSFISGSKLGFVISIWVEPVFRGMGLARHLIDEFIREAAARSVDTVIFELPGAGSVLKSSLEARGSGEVVTTMAVKVADV